MLLIQDDNPSLFHIRQYEPHRLLINDTWYEQSVMVSPKICQPFAMQHKNEVCEHDLEPVFDLKPEVVLLGTGSTCQVPPASLMSAFLSKGIGFEFMDSRAACHTFSVLSSENRAVVAIILID